MQINETMIRNVVSQVLAEVVVPESASISRPANGSPKHGVFHDANEAVDAAHVAFEKLQARSMEDRKKIIGHIRRISIDQSVELGTMEMEETKIGRLEHKIDKLKTLGQRSPGVEFLKSEVFTGDQGIAVIEHAPFGVIGAITPVTHSLPTITGNAVSMIAAGNTLVVNPHPSGKKVATEGVRRFNKAIYEDLGIDNLICVIAEPTLETADAIFSHRDVAIICVTGGPAVARAALNSGKRAVVAGPGNPPVVVDETADLKNAAESIITGGAYDNNLLCIAEKEVFVVSSVFDELMRQMEIAGAHLLNSQQIADLTSKAIIQVGADNHDAPAKEYLGQDASVLAAAA
ncbi:MAG: aldehyde dehydrogenase, partial [Pirellulaceae bacterium]|nr:aldehyde dehydrogenase [Pirellulaceae bacterium]